MNDTTEMAAVTAEIAPVLRQHARPRRHLFPRGWADVACAAWALAGLALAGVLAACTWRILGGH